MKTKKIFYSIIYKKKNYDIIEEYKMRAHHHGFCKPTHVFAYHKKIRPYL